MLPLMAAWKEREEKVVAACAELEALRKQNRGLKTRVKKLESELAQGDGAGGWVEEREEVRKRVSKLAQGLETLV